MAGNCYTILPKEWDHLRKGLINIQNIDDNGYFKWCLVKYLHPADHHSARFTKADKDFARKCDFQDIKYPLEIRDIHKIEIYIYIYIYIYHQQCFWLWK